MTALDDQIVAGITRLVREAPALDAAVLEALVLDLRARRSPLASSIARIAELVGEQLVDSGVALPALAMACHTLATTSDAAVLEAARYEIETLTPMPDRELVQIRPRG